ncbi:hypothetical protein ACP7H9_07720 [Idiomarina sp. ST20R2A10]|uniref:hypothetical protein n=1 Tax=Idiomarina sp. ST20R2A10 TaxID=3418369 RepID=UPI003EC87809
MLSDGLKQATENLVIQDVYFESINADVLEREFFLKNASTSSEQACLQQKFGVKRLAQEESDNKKLVYFTFDAGLRWTLTDDEEASEDDIKQNVLAHIECEIVACYLLKSDVAEEHLKEFAFKNSGIHVWPYWREFLTSTCERLRLPRVMMPTVRFQSAPIEEAE